MFTAALSTIKAKTWKTTCPLIDEWITMRHIYTKKYYLAIKKNEIMLFAATWINLEMIILIEASQEEKDKYYMILLICEIYKMVQRNLFIKEKYNHRC